MTAMRARRQEVGQSLCPISMQRHERCDAYWHDPFGQARIAFLFTYDAGDRSCSMG